MAAQPGRCRGPRLSEDKRIAKSNNSTLCLTRPPKPERLSKTTAKPYEGFPLTPHPSGRWCKKIRGKLHYFGKLDSSDAALGHSVCAQVGTCLGGSPAGNVGAAAEGPAGGGWRRGRKMVCGTRFTAHSWPVCARQ